jgi:hypothetical protein
VTLANHRFAGKLNKLWLRLCDQENGLHEQDTHNKFEPAVIPGTFLIRLAGDATLSAKNWNRRGFYLCTKSGSLKVIREGNVHAGNTVAGGCVGRKRFIAYWARKARNIRHSLSKVVISMLRLLKKTLLTRLHVCVCPGNFRYLATWPARFGMSGGRSTARSKPGAARCGPRIEPNGKQIQRNTSVWTRKSSSGTER